MSLSNQQFVDLTRRLARERGIDLDPVDIRASRDKALQLLGEQVANSAKHAHLQQTYSGITFTSGSADISGQAGLLYDKIRRVTHSDGTTTTEVTMLPMGCTQRDLNYERNQFVYWGVQEANSIYVMKGDGATDPGDGTINITASYVPTIAQVPNNLIDDLIEVAVMLTQGAMQ